MKKLIPMLALFLLVFEPAIAGPPTALRQGTWRAWLDSPGGELPFGLQLVESKGQWSAAILNGAERIEIPVVRFEGDELILSMPHYDSAIKAGSSANGTRLDGEWKKRSKGDRVVTMKFHADAGRVERFLPTALGIEACQAGGVTEGRWSIQFAADADRAVGVFEQGDERSAIGTILTTTGDYRYLAGDVCWEQPGEGKLIARLRLSTFDGAHAFLFSATTDSEAATMTGDFWSGDTFHDTWTARRDANAELPDAFTLTKAMESAKLDEVVFPDLEGKRKSLADPSFAGKARIIEIFGTWCPNCNDASKYLGELQVKFKGRGLSILGLAFEYSGDTQRDTEQVRTFAKHHKIEFPILLAGTSDREKASASLPIIDKLRAYPTLLVLDQNNKIQATYTGFSGPATGEDYQRFKTQFEATIEKLLAE